MDGGERDHPAKIAETGAALTSRADATTPEDQFAAAHQVCPYSNATRGNVDVALTVV